MGQGRSEEDYEGIKDWLKHIITSKELALLLVGAALTGFLLPVFLQQSQDHQKELEVKTNIVKQISETTSHPITLVQALEGMRRGDNSTEFVNDTKKTLTTERLNVLRTGSTIKSQLQTYFPDTLVPQRWQNLTTATHNFIKLFQFDDPTFRSVLATSIYMELLGNITSAERNNIINISQRNSTDYADSYSNLQNLIINKQDNLIDMIRKNPIPAYHNIFN